MLAIVFALALAAVACGGGGGTGVTPTPGTEGTSEPLTSAQHAEQLAKGESAALAAELVEVPGHFYEDVGDEELEHALDEVSKSGMEPLAVSFHGVRQLPAGDEIAFLQLFALDPNDAIHAPANWERAARLATGAEDIRGLEFSGQTVFLAEDSSRPASRYTYVWLRHGTLGDVDGPDQAPLERWLTAYFAVAVVLPGENPALVDRLANVPGFAYANETRPEGVQHFFTGQAFAGADYSIHQVFDETHNFGTIVLIGPEQSLTEHDFVARFASFLAEVSGTPPVETAGLGMEDMAVHRFLSEGGGESRTAFAWWWADARIGGALVTERPDIGEPFLRAFFAAQPS